MDCGRYQPGRVRKPVRFETFHGGAHFLLGAEPFEAERQSRDGKLTARDNNFPEL